MTSPRVATGVRWATIASAVVAAMALGQLITEKLPDSVDPSAPFVRHGEVGETVELRYADVTVTGVRSAQRLLGTSTVLATGTFLIADVKYVGQRKFDVFEGFEVLDGEGRRYAMTTRGGACPSSLSASTGVPSYAIICFDLPKRALKGARLVFSRDGYGVNGSDQRRDDLAEIDLGIDAKQAESLWSSTLTYEGQQGTSFNPVNTTPVEPESDSEEAP